LNTPYICGCGASGSPRCRAARIGGAGAYFEIAASLIACCVAVLIESLAGSGVPPLAGKVSRDAAGWPPPKAHRVVLDPARVTSSKRSRPEAGHSCRIDSASRLITGLTAAHSAGGNSCQNTRRLISASSFARQHPRPTTSVRGSCRPVDGEIEAGRWVIAGLRLHNPQDQRCAPWRCAPSSRGSCRPHRPNSSTGFWLGRRRLVQGLSSGWKNRLPAQPQPLAGIVGDAKFGSRQLRQGLRQCLNCAIRGVLTSHVGSVPARPCRFRPALTHLLDVACQHALDGSCANRTRWRCEPRYNAICSAPACSTAPELQVRGGSDRHHPSLRSALWSWKAHVIALG